MEWERAEKSSLSRFHPTHVVAGAHELLGSRLSWSLPAAACGDAAPSCEPCRVFFLQVMLTLVSFSFLVWVALVACTREWKR
jgi:hypothetical protein